ncbi:helix-turn-helix domain-containing protein [Dermacoccus abyssi]|uniref:helix-turn-helix transcriptional regulator n=1 Tax=Dermacoccus abyssi TaxID=322596 RepID=UPI0021A96D9B|nr:helix-turn-helix domain-containing protein [Dermacoccus abyssi]MCT1986602.1 helix-turn-helix domain-containing protein [Dermacoccus abyssi]
MTTSEASLMMVSPLMHSREVAAYLKVSESTLSRWRSAGTGPPFLRLGGIARYRIDAVDAWLGRLESDHAPEG